MCKLEENYSIHICLESEVNDLCRFIDDYWKKNHALARNRQLMDWQHYDAENGLYNFVVAKHIKTDTIHGVLGFISTKHFDNSLNDVDLWLAIWKIKDDIQVPGLGLSLLDFLISHQQPRSVAAIGLNPNIIKLYKCLNYKIGILNHYYIINDQISDFKLIDNFDGRCYTESIADDYKTFIRYEKSEFLNLSGEFQKIIPDIQIPSKSHRYFLNRYFAHPAYNYHVYGVVSHDSIVGVLVLRLVSHNSGHALRIVDYCGDIDGLSGTFKAFRALLQIHKAEYVDFYNIGIEEKILTDSGFIKRDSTADIIIPNYFEPFEKRNIDLDYAYKCDKNLDFSICRGDSDQDRPNSIL